MRPVGRAAVVESIKRAEQEIRMLNLALNMLDTLNLARSVRIPVYPRLEPLRYDGTLRLECNASRILEFTPPPDTRQHPELLVSAVLS